MKLACRRTHNVEYETAVPWAGLQIAAQDDAFTPATQQASRLCPASAEAGDCATGDLKSWIPPRWPFIRRTVTVSNVHDQASQEHRPYAHVDRAFGALAEDDCGADARSDWPADLRHAARLAGAPARGGSRRWRRRRNS